MVFKDERKKQKMAEGRLLERINFRNLSLREKNFNERSH